MKNINKIIGIIGLLFCVLQPISAQFRMGIDWSCGMPKSYFYSTRYYDDEGTYMPTAHAGFSFEYVLPRHIMPLYLPLSIKSGVYYAHYEELPLNKESESYYYGESIWGQGVGIPLVGEVKYLINNHIRVYANAGVTFNALFIDDPYYSGYEGEEGGCRFKVGGTTEAGIEFRNFRIGFGYRGLFSTFYGYKSDGEKKAGSGFVSMGWRFGGNRLFKKNSKLSVY